MEEWISGRARFVGDGFVTLGAGVARADVVAAAAAIVAPLEEALARARRLVGADGSSSGSTEKYQPNDVKSPSSAEPALTGGDAPVLLGAMNAQLLHSVAHQVRAESKGRMVGFNMKVQPDFEDRLQRTAARFGMTVPDYLRALVVIHTEEEKKS